MIFFSTSENRSEHLGSHGGNFKKEQPFVLNCWWWTAVPETINSLFKTISGSLSRNFASPAKNRLLSHNYPCKSPGLEGKFKNSWLKWNI